MKKASTHGAKKRHGSGARHVSVSSPTQREGADAVRLLREAGLKVTEQRVLVLVRLMQNRHATSVDDLASVLDGIANVVTIYRTLDTLLAANIIAVTSSSRGARLFEFQREHHHPVSCVHCGHSVTFASEELEREMVHAAGAASRFHSIDRHTLEFFGTCARCAA